MLGLFAAGCLIAAVRWAEDGVDRAVYLGGFAINALAAGSMIYRGYEYTWRLMPALPL